MKKYVIVFGCATLALTSLSWAAQSRVQVSKIRSNKTVVIPERAVQVADNVFSLGTAFDSQSGKMVEGYAIIRYAKGGKPSAAKDKTSSCYGFLARGAKWKVDPILEPWVVNPSNTPIGKDEKPNPQLDKDEVFRLLSEGIDKWEDATDGIVDNSKGEDVLGTGSITTDILVADTVSPDEKNEVYFADIASPNAIGVTIVWGIFGGPPSGRELVEWDQIYDDYDFDWSLSTDENGELGKMDFDSIATHELGHSMGMGDLYNSVCSEQTMFGYASTGETNKRTLESGDIAGISKLYK
ncbi:matrixin family metalloprotease [Candidatus Gracilibacteria bacterium]|nr:matrixin family metalloprotease [Candidatus Gracilibacteria bacterium]